MLFYYEFFLQQTLYFVDEYLSYEYLLWKMSEYAMRTH